MQSYMAVVHKEPHSDFGVSFPDFPGCVTAGETVDKAKEMGQEALELHIQGLVEDGAAIPNPRKLENILLDPDYRDVIAFLVFSVPPPRKKSIRVNITLPEEILAEIDSAAKERGYSRSALLAHAARLAIGMGIL